MRTASQLFSAATLILLVFSTASAQTNEFTYQGSLTNSGTPATGNYDFEFALFDTLSGGGQQGATLTRISVAVVNGVFTVPLDFGSQFTGANRFLAISVRPTGGGAYTPLLPRQQISSSPYAIRTISATSADSLSGACVACVQDAQINSLAGSKVSGAIPVAGIPAGSANYVQNTASQQASSNFNITGNGTVGSMNINGPLTQGGTAPPAAAPAGQGRIYFDSATNKVKVSENGAAFVNLVGATGVNGSGTANSVPLWSAGTTLANSLIAQSAGGNIGVNTLTPQSKFHVNGSSWFQGDTTPLPASAGKGIVVGFGGEQGYISAFDYGTFTPKNLLLNLTGGNVGIGTPTPLVPFHVNGSSLFVGGTTVTGANGDNAVITARRSDADPWIIIDSPTISRSTVLAYRKNNVNRWLLFTDGVAETGSNAGSDFRLDAYGDNGVGIANYLLVKRSSGNVGIGTSNPATRLNLVGGPTWTSNFWTASMNLQNGSALAWDANASGQRWGIGQSNGGLYFFRSFSAFGTTASPADYAMTINDNGNISQARDKSGLVKAMIYVNADGSISRCYNGISNSSTGNCGFSISVSAVYTITFPFQVNDRFVSITPQTASTVNIVTSFVFAPSVNNQIWVRSAITDVDYNSSVANNPFMIIIY